jgi:CDP-glycerol glycerophosphotransferase
MSGLIHKLKIKLFDIYKPFEKYILSRFLGKNGGRLWIFFIPIRLARKLVLAGNVAPQKVVLTATSHDEFVCNPKYIALELARRELDADLVFIVKKGADVSEIPSNVRVVFIEENKHHLHEIATARIFINNSRSHVLVRHGWRKHADQIYLNTWHGSFGIKTIGNAQLHGFKDGDFVALDAAYIDYFITHSLWEEQVLFQNNFSKKPIKSGFLRFGHPRNDVFFKPPEEQSEIRAKVFKHLGIAPSVRTVLYAPTFAQDKRFSSYDLDCERVAQEFTKKFGGDWIVMQRLHPKVQKYKWMSGLNGKHVTDANSYTDTQELLIATDAVITDYSSIIFDFLLTGRPGFIYASNIAEYERTRGLFYPLSETPFQIAETNDEMANNIQSFDAEIYAAKVAQFLKGKEAFEDGHAAERTADFIEKILNTPLQPKPQNPAV